MKPFWTRRLLPIALALGASNAQALCTGVCGCTVATTNMSFVNVNPLAATSAPSTSTVTVSCGGVAGLFVSYSVAFSAGNSGSFATRKMVNGANQLAYNLYQDAGLTTVWGDGTGGSQSQSGGVTLVALGTYSQSFTVYGSIPLPQSTVAPSPTPYGDSISVNVTYY